MESDKKDGNLLIVWLDKIEQDVNRRLSEYHTEL